MGPLKERMRAAGKKKLLPVILCAVAALAGIIGLSVYAGWYYSPSQKLLRALEAEDLVQAQQLYSQLEEAPEGLPELICEKLEEVGEQYVHGKMDYAAAEHVLTVYEAMAVPGTSKALDSCRGTLQTVRASREYYVLGQQQEASRDYPAAMESYSKVLPEDLWGWENAREKILQCRELYRTQILEESDALAQAGAYPDALARLQEGLSVLKEDAVLLAQVSACQLAYEEQQRLDRIAQAQALAAGRDFPAALALLSDHESHEQLHSAYLALCEEYVDWTLTTAQGTFSEEGYEAALALIETCLLSLPDHERLLEGKALYESYAPVYLSEYPLTLSEGSKLYVDVHSQDRSGNTYRHSLAVNKGSIHLELGGEFSALSGTVACPAGFLEDSYRTGAGIEILADGVVIYSSGILQVSSQPIWFQLDISGVQELTITWQCEGANIWKNWGDRATLFDLALSRHEA